MTSAADRMGARDAAALSLNTLYSMPLVSGGPAYTCTQLVQAMNAPGFETRIFAPLDRRPAAARQPPALVGLPTGFNRLPYALTRHVADPIIERRFEQRCRASDASSVAYLWGETPLDLTRRLSRQGVFMVREKINSGKKVSVEILRQAYSRIGAEDAFDDTTYRPARIAKEQEELERADYVFCPSPMVRDSLARIGLPEAKLIETSYGYDPARVEGSTRALAPIDGPTLLFVGYICVRKGAHILLDAWERAGLRGRLVLLGRMEPLIAERFARTLARDDVEHHPFTSDVGGYFRSADYFVFPSLEEGSPLVTYEAIGAGLPSIVSEMGSGGAVRDGVEGAILDSDDADAWAECIARLNPGSEAHAAQAAAARCRAPELTWAAVGARRRDQLIDRARRHGLVN